MHNKTLLASAVAATLAVASAPSFAGYYCTTNELTGYVQVSNFAPTLTPSGPVFDGTFNAMLRDLQGTVTCEVPPSGLYNVEVSGTVYIDYNQTPGWDLIVPIINPLSIFGGALNITGLTPGLWTVPFTNIVNGAFDGPGVPFAFDIEYDGNTSATALAMINGLFGTSFVNTDGAGKLEISGLMYADGVNATIKESNLTWAGFEALLFAADNVFDPAQASPNMADGTFMLKDVRVHIPEPATLGLLGLGLIGLAAARRRKAA